MRFLHICPYFTHSVLHTLLLQICTTQVCKYHCEMTFSCVEWQLHVPGRAWTCVPCTAVLNSGSGYILLIPLRYSMWVFSWGQRGNTCDIASFCHCLELHSWLSRYQPTVTTRYHAFNTKEIRSKRDFGLSAGERPLFTQGHHKAWDSCWISQYCAVQKLTEYWVITGIGTFI